MKIDQPEINQKKLTALELRCVDAITPLDAPSETRDLIETRVHQEFKTARAQLAEHMASLYVFARHAASEDRFLQFVSESVGVRYQKHYEEQLKALFSFIQSNMETSYGEYRKYCLSHFDFKEQVIGRMESTFSKEEMALFSLPEMKENLPFKIARVHCHEMCARGTEKRFLSGVPPTEEELRMGVFREQLELPVRNALFVMNRKGYATSNSGFWGKTSNEQRIAGFFDIDEATKKRFLDIGVVVLPPNPNDGKRGQTSIIFYPKSTDLFEMKKKWDEVAEILPDMGHRAPPSFGGDLLRIVYAPERIDIEREMLTYDLSLGSHISHSEEELRRRLAGVIKKLENNA